MDDISEIYYKININKGMLYGKRKKNTTVLLATFDYARAEGSGLSNSLWVIKTWNKLQG